MKTKLLVVAVLVSFFVVSGRTQPSVNPGWKMLTTLVGEWQGHTSGGASVHARYQLHSGDSALVETLEPAGESSMVTVYHMDGASLMMTHYCAAKNQPRMRATSSPDGKQITFTFFDATNLPDPSVGHMKKLVVTFADANHFQQEWTFREAGKEHTEKFEFTRAK